jgi:FAD binding domain
MITYQRQEQEEIAAPFEAIVGPERALFDEGTRQRYARTTGLQCIMPARVLYPQTTQEVVEIVRAANPLKIALYPISRGKNWGYGDACAASVGQVILESPLEEKSPRLLLVVGHAGKRFFQAFGRDAGSAFFREPCRVIRTFWHYPLGV